MAKRESPAPADLRQLNEQFVSGLLAQIDEVRNARELLYRRAHCLERIDEAIDNLTAELGVQVLLDTLLPRLADAVGAAALVVELSQPPPERIVGYSSRAPAGQEVPSPAVEWKHPLAVGRRSLGFLCALYATGAGPQADDEAVLSVVAHQVALAVENARLYERESRLRHELEAQDRRKDDFLAVLAHELRAPLAPILSAMNLIAQPDSASDLGRTVREVVERQVRYQAGLLDDLLDLTRIAHDKIELRRHATDLRSVAAAAVEVSRPSIEERRQGLAVSVPEDRLLVTADPVRLEQVVINLLNNATKYTPVGGDISLTVERRGEEASIAVRDSGEGIPPEMLDRVFDPFVQATRAVGPSRQGGLGIGLALAKRLAELHAGTIEARSAGRGQGSEFIVRLPLATPLDSTPGLAVRAPSLPPVEPARVLIVEDDGDTREMLSLTLELAGHRVTVAETGRAGIERAPRSSRR